MIAIALLVVSAVLWQEQFTDCISSMNQLYDYTVDIVHDDGKVTVQAHPQEDGFAAAWFSVDHENPFPDNSVLKLTLKIRGNRVRLRYFCLRKGHSVYFAGEASVGPDEHWQDIEISLHDARPFYSSNFPASLTPEKEPVLFLIIENSEPGAFNIEIDDTMVLEVEEEK